MSGPFRPAWAVPPGEFLAEELAERGWSQAQARERLQWEPVVLERVLASDRAIDEALAADLSRTFGTSLMYWLNLQQMYDDWRRGGGKPG